MGDIDEVNQSLVMLKDVEINNKLITLQKLLNDPDTEKKLLEIKGLTEDQKEVLKTLITKNGLLLQNLITLMEEITNDNVINAKDIPFLILFIKDLYVFLYSIKKDLKLNSKQIQEIIPILVKFLITYLLKENVDLPSEQSLLIEQIVDSAINVLQVTTEMKISSYSFSKFATFSTFFK